MKTSELIGHALDWAVAKCQDKEKEWMHDHKIGYVNSASTDWAQGGPIIEREKITVWNDDVWWHAAYTDGTDDAYGQTPLIAAMRCYVTSKLGDTVDVPEELK